MAMLNTNRESHYDFDICMSMLTEYDSDGFLGLAWDAPGDQQSGVSPAEVHGHGGILHRPRDPDRASNGNPTLGHNVLRIWEGNVAHIVVLSDPRAIPKLPRLGKGGSVFYADTGNPQLPFDEIDPENGTRTIYVPYSFVDGVPQKAMLIAINVDNAGQESIQIIHGAGMSITMTAGALNSIVVANKAGNAYIEINDNGLVLNGNTVINGGATIGSPVGALPAAIATKLAAYLAQLETDIASSMTAIGAGTAAAGAAGAAAFAAGAAARAALSAQIPALKTSVA